MPDLSACVQVHRHYQIKYGKIAETYNLLPTIECVLMVYCLPFICVFGFALNLFCIGLFCRVWLLRRSREVRRKRSSLYGNSTASTLSWSLVPYLIALSTFDAIQLLLSIFVLFFPSLLANSRSSIRPNELDSFIGQQNVATYMIWIFYPICMTANYASIWTISVICVQRFFAICYPLASRRYSWLHRGKTSILIVTSLAVILNFIRYWEHQVAASTIPHPLKNGSELKIFYLQSNPLQTNFGYKLVFEGIIYGLSMYVLPLLLLISMNARILYVIRQARKSEISIPLRQKREYRSSHMVCAVVLVFFICHTISPVSRWWELIDRDILIRSPPTHPVFLLQDLSNFLINLNSAANPLVYFMFTRKFKDLFGEVRRLQQARNRSLVVHGSIQVTQFNRNDEAETKLISGNSSEADRPGFTASIRRPTTRGHDIMLSPPSMRLRVDSFLDSDVIEELYC